MESENKVFLEVISEVDIPESFATIGVIFPLFPSTASPQCHHLFDFTPDEY